MTKPSHPALFHFTRIGLEGANEVAGTKGALRERRGAVLWSLVERIQDLGTDNDVFDDCSAPLVYVAMRGEGMYITDPIDKVLKAWNNYLFAASLVTVTPSAS